jgi:hypothetical protein
MANASGAPVTGPWSLGVHGIAQWLVGNQQHRDLRDGEPTKCYDT